jgi:hypothetical protein
MCMRLDIIVLDQAGAARFQGSIPQSGSSWLGSEAVAASCSGATDDDASEAVHNNVQNRHGTIKGHKNIRHHSWTASKSSSAGWRLSSNTSFLYARAFRWIRWIEALWWFISCSASGAGVPIKQLTSPFPPFQVLNNSKHNNWLTPLNFLSSN